MKQEALKQLNEVMNEHFTTIEEAENALSERFGDLYSDYEEAQESFDELDRETNGLLGKYFVYTLSAPGETWHVGLGEKYQEENLPTYIEMFQKHYNESFENADDLTSKLENRVMKTMDNAGCDAFTALSMILAEDLSLLGLFVIVGADSEPRIEWANFDQI